MELNKESGLNENKGIRLDQVFLADQFQRATMLVMYAVLRPTPTSMTVKRKTITEM